MLIFIKERIKSFIPAIEGFQYLLKNEKNALIHLIATIAVIFLSYIFKLNDIEWILILLAITFVWFAELINTSIEKLTDLIQPEINPIAKIIKDLAASAVLITAVFSIIIALIVFLPKLFKLIN